jgi:1,2-dihydroxy-3-keto-5-methylthiopentene dioxygenase
MAQLKLENGKTLNDLTEIRNYLNPLGIELSHWPIEKTAVVGPLLQSDALDNEQKEVLLKVLDNKFEEQKNLYGYQTRDLIVLHPKVENIQSMLNIFNKAHTHSDDEVRYIIDGSGYFGFMMPDKEQVMLLVEAEEYIRVPKDTEHWFILSPEMRIKAVRYFTSKEGWVANYTGAPIRV